MGAELAQAYDLFKDPIRRAGDAVLVLDVMKDLDDIARRMKPGQGLDLDPVYLRDLGFPQDRDDDNPGGAESHP